MSRVVVQRSRDPQQHGTWLVMSDEHVAHVGSFAAALHFATRLTTQPRQERQAMKTPTTTRSALALERVIALAEHALAVAPDLETCIEDRRALDTVRDDAAAAWLAQ